MQGLRPYAQMMRDQGLCYREIRERLTALGQLVPSYALLSNWLSPKRNGPNAEAEEPNQDTTPDATTGATASLTHKDTKDNGYLNRINQSPHSGGDNHDQAS